MTHTSTNSLITQGYSSNWEAITRKQDRRIQEEVGAIRSSLHKGSLQGEKGKSVIADFLHEMVPWSPR